MADTLDTVRAALRAHCDELLARPNVVAAGIGYKVSGGQETRTLSVVCSVTRKRPVAELAAAELVPAQVEGVPTDVVETGPIRALGTHTSRQRPAPGGASIGHRDITAGTLGCVVRRDGQRYILSNNHVLADSNAAQPGDPILQPGPVDGGRLPEDRIAELTEFVPIRFPGEPSACGAARRMASVMNACARLLGSRTRFQAVHEQVEANLVDAAIARPLDDEDVSDEILDIGRLSGTGRAELGMAVKKSGRTTGFTEGVIRQVDVTVRVQYGGGRTATFTDQLMASPMSRGGDSGSAVVDRDNRLVGLLFAGSEQSTIINRIEHVFTALRVGL